MKEVRIFNADESEFGCAEADLLTKANDETPDVVIMDTATPVLGGLNAAKKILEVRPEGKIIVLSMEDDDALVWCVLHVGERGDSLKSECSRNLVATVRSACSGPLV